MGRGVLVSIKKPSVEGKAQKSRKKNKQELSILYL